MGVFKRLLALVAWRRAAQLGDGWVLAPWLQGTSLEAAHADDRELALSKPLAGPVFEVLGREGRFAILDYEGERLRVLPAGTTSEARLSICWKSKAGGSLRATGIAT